MIKEEVKKSIFEQMEIIPSWKKGTQMTADEIRSKLAKRLEFENIRKWLMVPGVKLDISSREIGEKWFQFMLFFVLDQDNDDCHFFSNMQLLNLEAQDKSISITERWGIYNIQSFSLEEFMEFAKVPF